MKIFASLFFLSAAFGSALAEVNPPHNPTFPKAEYPYAQAPDGCSSASNNPQQVRDSWGSVDFKPTCDAHDACYYTVGSDWKNCNEAFRTGLSNACFNDLRVWVPGVQRRVFDFSKGKFKWVTVTEGSWAPPEPNTLKLCLAVANSYYAAVQAGVGLGVFQDAQKLQKQYEAWIESLFKSEPKYALTCISNSLSSAVNYQYRWGSDNWKSQRLEAGKLIAHYFPYPSPGQRSSPEFLVRFDRDFGAGDDFKTYRMHKFAFKTTSCKDLAQRDRFKKIRESSRFVDLYHDGGQRRSYDYAAAADSQGDSLGMFLDGVAPNKQDYVATPGNCAVESSRFENFFGGCADRSQSPVVVYSAPKYVAMTQGAAFDYCEDLTEGGFDDWSLPPNLLLESLSGLPFETHFSQPTGASNQSNDRWEFWSSSVASQTEAGAVILRCLDEDKLGDGEKCSATTLTKTNERRYAICSRTVQIP